MTIYEYMRLPDRQIFGKVEVTYITPLRSSVPSVVVPSEPYNSRVDQIADQLSQPSFKNFVTFDNKLDGTSFVSDGTTQVGWWSLEFSKADNTFDQPLIIEFDFSPRPLNTLDIIGNRFYSLFPVDFDIEVIAASGNWSQTISNNTQVNLRIEDLDIVDATKLTLTVRSINKPNKPLWLIEVSVGATFTYESNQLMNFSLLEELSYEEDSEALGGVSANEFDVTFDNSEELFYFNNSRSQVSSQLKKNRKVSGYLGWVDPDTSVLEWIPLGVFWTYKWDVPKGSLIAKCVAFDSIGLLDTTDFYDHKVMTNVSLGYLIEFIITDAQKFVLGLTYSIDRSLYDIIVPYAWFNKDTHTQALKRVATSYMVDIYCNRQGTITARDRTAVEPIIDEWSESTNITYTEYPTLYTTSKNTVNIPVYVINTSLQDVINITDSFEVEENAVVDFLSNYPINDSVTVTIDSTATSTYEWYSWGLRITFTSAGTVSSVKVNASILDIDTTTVVTKNIAELVLEDGPQIADLYGPFIQSVERANVVADSFLENAQLNKFDAEVQYRGNPGLMLGNSIKLKESIAPTDEYVMKRQQLFWDGALTGSASLFTRGG